MMQVKLSVLKEEKRLLMLKLKQRELQMRREADVVDDSEQEYETESEMEEAAAGLENINKKNFFQIVKQKKRSRSESPFAR